MKTTIERVNRTIIENKLLAALESDSGQVAILATEQDLKDLHAALCGYKLSEQTGNLISWAAYEQRRKDLAADIKMLLDSAFPQREQGIPLEKPHGLPDLNTHHRRG